MIIFAIFAWIVVIFIFRVAFTGQRHPYDVNRNLTLYNLIKDDEFDLWLQESQFNVTVKKSTSSGQNLIIDDTNKEYDLEILESPLNNQQLSDDPNQSSVEDDILEHLLSSPSRHVEPDWPIVLGHFDHYGDENWSNYLIETELPFLVRWYLTDAPESVYIYKKFSNSKGEEFATDKPNLDSSKGFKVVIETTSWLITHESVFRLGETYIENDLDGTDSKNTFFFSAPRLLIHNKIKDKWKTTIVRHFDENGLNMTFIDRERMVVARRFMERVR